MSQPGESYPAFNIIGADGAYFESQTRHAANGYHQPWTQPGHQHMQSAPSPSAASEPQAQNNASGYHQPWMQPGHQSRRNTPSPSASRFYNGQMSAPPNVHRSDGRMHANLQGLTHLAVPNPPGRPHSNISSPSDVDHISSPIYPYTNAFSSSSTGVLAHTLNPQSNTGHGLNNVNKRTDNTSVVDPLAIRMYSRARNDDPWNPMQVAYDNTLDNSSFPGQNTWAYRDQRGSEVESAVGPRSDSGYGTHPAPPPSVMSHEPERTDQDLPPEIFQTANLKVGSAPSESTEGYFPAPSDQASQYSGRSGSQSKGTHKCPRCKEVSKCPSDFKKHMLKHDKPHTCDFSGCRRAALGKGFTTINDLQRHKKSVHRIGVERDSYQCASEHCRNRGKIWPRLDNFKQHISRMHKDEEDQELIRKSQYRGPIPPLAMTQADMLAGIGVEGQHVGNELDDPASGISLTPDQDVHPWISFDPSGSQKFALDVDRFGTRDGEQFFSGRPSYLTGFESDRKSATPVSSIKQARFCEDSLVVLADAASTKGSSGGLGQRQLSSAPQTKAEQQKVKTQTDQQRMALQKFGKALIAEYKASSSIDPTLDGADLENVVIRVMSGTTHSRQDARSTTPTNPPADDIGLAHPIIESVMTKAEALKASQALSNLIKQSPSSPFTSRSRRTSRVSTSSDRHQCTRCEVTLARACDMKKHMKRHTKPYGCTYPHCYKRFGAKSDWKRHENSQHFQMEVFRCQIPTQKPHPHSHSQPHTTLDTVCGGLFQRLDLFKHHLQTAHKVGDSTLQDEIKTSRIGKNYQGQFWCGFCEAIVKLKEKRNAAWDERFDHIDRHFSKEKKSIELWVCVEARKSKGEVLREMHIEKEREEEDGSGSGSGEEVDGEEKLDDGFQVYESEIGPAEVPPVVEVEVPMPTVDALSRKREFPEDDESFAHTPVQIALPSKRRRTDVDRYCCSCKNGPWLGSMYVDCMLCGHHLCGNCHVDGVVVGGFDGAMMMG